MRSKKNVPVGQGCKRLKKINMNNKTFVAGKCQCHPDLYLCFCHGCGEQFHSPMPHTKTCSDRCRKRLSRSRNDKFFQTVLTYATGG